MRWMAFHTIFDGLQANQIVGGSILPPKRIRKKIVLSSYRSCSCTFETEKIQAMTPSFSASVFLNFALHLERPNVQRHLSHQEQ
eukprot:scaffold10176_cov83-Skeletonema_dohrnii-CCMP3373.AAC.3